MKRDLDLVRRIALAVADLPPGEFLDSLPGVSQAEFGAHAAWMEEAGLVKIAAAQYISNGWPIATVLRLTWQGCEFVDAVRSDTLWKKAKEVVIKPAASFTFGLLTEWLKAELAQSFPTLRSTT